MDPAPLPSPTCRIASPGLTGSTGPGLGHRGPLLPQVESLHEAGKGGVLGFSNVSAFGISDKASVSRGLRSALLLGNWALFLVFRERSFSLTYYQQGNSFLDPLVCGAGGGDRKGGLVPLLPPPNAQRELVSWALSVVA